LAAFKRLDDQARRIECLLSGSRVEALIAEEKRLSHSYAGRSVFGREPPPKDRAGVDSAAAAQAPARSIAIRRQGADCCLTRWVTGVIAADLAAFAICMPGHCAGESNRG